MRIASLVLLCLLVTPIALRAEPPFQTRPATPQLVGFSEAETVAFVGLFELNHVCSAEFGPGAFMCSTHDLARAVPVVDDTRSPFEVAWVRVDARAPVFYFPEIDQSCQGWFTNGHGVGVSKSGKFRRKLCSQQLPVACCWVAPGN